MLRDDGNGSGVCSGDGFWSGFGYGSGSAPGEGWHLPDETSDGDCRSAFDSEQLIGDGSGSGDGSSLYGRGYGDGWGLVYSEDEGRHYNRAFVCYDYVYLTRGKIERRMYDGQAECYLSLTEAEAELAVRLLTA